MEIPHYAYVFTVDGHLGCYILRCGTCLQSQLCKRLRQEDHLSPGFQGQLGQHGETSSLKTVIRPLAPSCHLQW
uniref:Uncharacterized protein n=1 Tax=Macaca nemestrina TaxID=9545 RepID=A0A2K6BQV8_MACNE